MSVKAVKVVPVRKDAIVREKGILVREARVVAADWATRVVVDGDDANGRHWIRLERSGGVEDHDEEEEEDGSRRRRRRRTKEKKKKKKKNEGERDSLPVKGKGWGSETVRQ